MRQLAAATGGFYHCSLSRATVYYKGSAQSRRRVCRRNAEQITIFIQCLMMLCGVGSRRDRALSYDHHEAGSGHWQQLANKAPTQRGERKMRQSPCDGTD